MEKTVLILGASGLFGGHAAKAFAAAGWTVRNYQRGTDMVQAAQGVQVIVNGLNPPIYHDWKTLIPQITGQVIAAGQASGATVIVPGNVYVYGTQPGPWGPDTPHRPVARKGAIRAEMEAQYRKAAAGRDAGHHPARRRLHRAGGAGQFSEHGGAEGPGQRPDRGARRAGHVTRAWAYLPDMTRAAVALADKRADLPAFTDMPFPGFTLTMGGLKTPAGGDAGPAREGPPFPLVGDDAGRALLGTGAGIARDAVSL